MKRTTLLAALAVVATSGQAFAWGDVYTGDATNDPNSNFIYHPYHGENNCPEGLQPVRINGQICCGTPTAGAKAFYNPAPKRKMTHKPVKKRVMKVRTQKPRAVAVPGEKGVIIR